MSNFIFLEYQNFALQHNRDSSLKDLYIYNDFGMKYDKKNKKNTRLKIGLTTKPTQWITKQFFHGTYSLEFVNWVNG